jgi:hypothetical protein
MDVDVFLFLGLLRACELLEPECLVQMLKAVKHLSMNATMLEVLQNANALEILIRILEEQSSGPHSTVSHVFNERSNMLRILHHRKSQTMSSKHATTSAVSINQDKKKLHKLELYLA